MNCSSVTSIKSFRSFSLLLLLVITGCTNLAGVTKHNASHAPKLAKNNSGITYGVWLNGGTENMDAVITACKAIDNADPRCHTPEKYRLGSVTSAFGFSAGHAGVLTLKPIELDISPCVTGSNKCTYLKVLARPNMFGEILEIVSKPGDGKCNWSGLARAGGVVCTTFDWDYRKELNDWDTFNGEMTVNTK